MSNTMMKKAEKIAKREHAKFKRRPVENPAAKVLRDFDDECIKIVHDYSGDVTLAQKNDAIYASSWLFEYIINMEC